MKKTEYREGPEARENFEHLAKALFAFRWSPKEWSLARQTRTIITSASPQTVISRYLNLILELTSSRR